MFLLNIYINAGRFHFAVCYCSLLKVVVKQKGGLKYNFKSNDLNGVHLIFSGVKRLYSLSF